jgi:hypothetical protein
LVAAAPWLAAHTPLRSVALKQAIGPIRGSVRVGSASFGWFSSPTFADVEMRDPQGRPLISTPRVTVSRSLLGLMLDSSNVGTVHIERATVEVICSGDQTNVEETFAPLWESSDAVATAAVTVELAQAVVNVRDQDTQQAWVVDPADATIVVSRDGSVQIASTGAIAGTVRSEWSVKAAVGATGTIDGVIHAERLPLGLLAPLLRRVEPGTRLDGRLNADIAGQWEGNQAKFEGRVTATGFQLAAPWLGNDRITLATLDAPCKATLADRRLHVEQARLMCDLGEARLAGFFDTGDLLNAWRQPGLEAGIDLDLARLAAMLPSRLHLHQDLKVTSGRLTAAVRSQAMPQGVAWDGRLVTADIRGINAGRAVSWPQPIKVEFAAKQTQGKLPTVDRLTCESNFLRLEGSGSAERVALSAGFDLGRLTDQLGQFLDFGPVRPAGRGWLRLAVARDEGGNTRLAGDAELRDLVLAMTPAQTWREPILQLRFSAAGQAADSMRLDTAELHFQAAAESASLQLSTPIRDLSKLAGSSLRLTARGDLNRAKLLLGLPADWAIGGSAEATALMTYQSQAITFTDARAICRNVRFRGLGLAIQEPSMDVTASRGRFDLKGAKMDLANARVSCPSFVLDCPTIAGEFSEKGPLDLTVAGTVQGDAGRLQQWFPDVTAVTGNIAGQFQGQVNTRYLGDRLGMAADVTIRDFRLGPAATPTWRESAMRVAARARMEFAADTMHIDQMAVESSLLGVSATGKLSRLSTRTELAVTGDLNYDLEKLEPSLRGLLGPGAKLTGRDRRPFRVDGTLAKPVGSAGASWQQLQAFGFTVGPAELQVQMAGDGWARVAPINTTINQGRLRLEPYIRLSPALDLMFGKATGIDRARITPAVCAGSLGFAVPALAAVKDAEGEFSLTIEGSRIPLLDPAKADIVGRYVLHSARTAPGPLFQQLNQIFKGDNVEWRLPREVQVPFRLVNGRVYHQNVDLPFGDVDVRTSGSVGFDSSLDLTADVPVPAKWLGNRASGAKATTMRLPIRGTLNRPVIDEAALRQAMAQFTRDAASEAIRQEIEKGLQRMLRPLAK